MDVVLRIVLCLGIPMSSKSVQYTVTDSNIQLNCSIRAPPNGGIIQWVKTGPPRMELSSNTIIFQIVPQELRERLIITGDHSNREYNLMISHIKKSDEGTYECVVYGKPLENQLHTLIVIVGPTKATISDKKDNKVQGIEGHDLPVMCTADGGDPAPYMTLIINGEVVKKQSHHTIEHRLARISRSYDGVIITCEAGYDGITYTPKMDTAVIKLDLKPLTPTFSMDPLVTENTKSLNLTCTSNGSRPAPTERIWLIGGNNVDITSSSTSVSSTLTSDGTYTATSTLTYKINKVYNQQNMTCGFKNIASGNKYVRNSKRMNVQYAPIVTVHNRTFSVAETLRQIKCIVNGNPGSTFSRWQHRSNYGELIRELDGGGTLILPQQSEEIRYQDTGEYICMVNNGISDESGNLNQRGSGYVISQAKPRFLQGSGQVIQGYYGSNVQLNVSVFSEPKYNTLIWLKDDSSVSQASKYTKIDVPGVITDTVYGTLVKVDGYELSLAIQNLQKDDFVNYTLRLSNGIGQSMEHRIQLLSAGPPATPISLTLTDPTDSSILLQWSPGFDGGYDKTFIIQYRLKGTNSWQEREVIMEQSISQDKILSFTLTNLQAGTPYAIRMYAFNSVNRSLPSTTLVASTSYIHRDVVERSSFTGVVVGLSTVTLISLVINALFIYRILADGTVHGKSSTKSHCSDKVGSPDVYYNITDNQEENTHFDGNSYETLGTQDKPNIYEDLGLQSKDTQNKIYSNTAI